jgi:hypothetical protein
MRCGGNRRAGGGAFASGAAARSGGDAKQKVQTVHRSRVVLDIGGVRHITSVATLRSRPGSMLDAMFSGAVVVVVVLQQYAA